MIKNLEILIIDFSGRLVGIDCSEIKKVVHDIKSKKNKEMIDYYKQKERLLNLTEIFKIDKKIDNNLLVVEMDNDEEYLIIAPEVSSIIAIDASNILILPEFMKKRQNPFFVWGFVKNNNILVSLITFTYFLDRNKTYE